MLKVFTDFSLIKNPVRVSRVLAPFSPFPTHYKSKFAKYFKNAHKLIALTNLQNCDIAIFPAEWQGNNESRIVDFAERAKRAGKHVLMFMIQDFPQNPNEGRGSHKFPNTTVLKTSCYASKGDKLALSSLRPDTREFAAQYNVNVNPRNKHDIPTVGFCGQASTALRSQAIKTLRASRLHDNFIIRGGFWAGLPRNDIASRSPKYHAVRKEFIRNMVGSDYGLCIRGAGNFSLRLDETMSCSRIPVLINTDCVLPYQDHISWRDIIVIADDVRDVENRIMEFHSKLSPSEFIAAQSKCREIWENWLSLSGYVSKLHLLKR